MEDDQELLRRYVSLASREALGEIVRRYQDLVYSSALRQVRDRHLAEDVTQAVFLVLAQKARGIRAGSVLGGWLFTVTHRAAMHAMRKAKTQHRHERAAAKVDEGMNNSESALEWERISTALDATLAELSSSERDAVILRYFEDKSFAEIGQRMGLSTEAARKRVTRSLERLRGRLMGRGVSVSSIVVMAAAISAYAVKPAPAGVVLAGSGSAGAAGIAKGVIQMMGWAKIKAAVAVAAVVVLGLAGITGVILTSPLMAQQNAPANVAANVPVNQVGGGAKEPGAPVAPAAPQPGFFAMLDGTVAEQVVAFDLHQVQIGGVAGLVAGQPAKIEKTLHVIQSDSGMSCEIDDAGIRTVHDQNMGGEKVIYDDKLKTATIYPSINALAMNLATHKALGSPTIWQQYSAILKDSATNDEGSEQIDGKELERFKYAREQKSVGNIYTPERQITIWTDLKTNAIVQATESSAFAPAQSKRSEEYSHFELNPKLDEQMMSLDPPADYKVVTPVNYPSISRHFARDPASAVAELLEAVAPEKDSALPTDLEGLSGTITLMSPDVEEIGPVDFSQPQRGSNSGMVDSVSKWYAHVNLGRALGALPRESWAYLGAGKKRGNGSELIFWCSTAKGYQGIYDDLSVKDLAGPGPAGK